MVANKDTCCTARVQASAQKGYAEVVWSQKGPTGQQHKGRMCLDALCECHCPDQYDSGRQVSTDQNGPDVQKTLSSTAFWEGDGYKGMQCPQITRWD